jgi:hypothetical protein
MSIMRGHTGDPDLRRMFPLRPTWTTWAWAVLAIAVVVLAAIGFKIAGTR